ncbi:YoaK family protein [Pseudoxanthomonas winnipegensis]|uniref:YoaK family protein n=1 Tax=Pseudoxanthomonas TaxID=83618 RepID=UPI002578F567|nr:YoaK family protein [Pseudoxanthomonas winnipegensis]WJI16643.1 DUF1275 domain-containing protein [Pseudoxanthomonas winnipegensis]
MISKLPRWVWSGAWVMAFTAGIVNVVALLGFGHQGVSHMTGITSEMGARAAVLDLRGLAQLAGGAFFFVAGSALSGALIGDVALQLGRRYGLVLVLEAGLLLASVPLMTRASMWGLWLAACACGLQNAMATTYSGAVVRTTHVSGMFTDLGLAIGHGLRRMPLPWRRLSLCVTVITGFLAGGLAGALGFHRWSYTVLIAPAVICLGLACVYALYARRVAEHAASKGVA